jgi:hypothetical protein
MKGNVDGLSSLSRAFYERARMKLGVSLVLGAAALMLLGFCSEAGGQVNMCMHVFMYEYLHINMSIYRQAHIHISLYLGSVSCNDKGSYGKG